MSKLLKDEIRALRGGAGESNPVQSSRARTLVRGCYAYDGKFWMVPENFMFPSKANTFQAFTFWFLGMPEYRTQKDSETLLSPVPPFRKFDPSLMPAKIRQTFRNYYLPVLKRLESYIPQCHDSPTLAEVNSWYDIAIERLKEEVTYIFARNKWVSYTISNMAEKLLGSQIKKFGTDADKVRADARETLTHQNKACRTYRLRRR